MSGQLEPHHTVVGAGGSKRPAITRSGAAAKRLQDFPGDIGPIFDR